MSGGRWNETQVHPSTGWTFKRGARPKPTEGPRHPRGRLLSNATGEVRVRASGGSRTAKGAGWDAGPLEPELAKLDAVASRTAESRVIRTRSAPVARGQRVALADGRTGRVASVRRLNGEATVRLDKRHRGQRVELAVELSELWPVARGR